MRPPFIVLVVLTLLVVPAPAAFAWSNGTDGYNSYGTHDWSLDKAIEALGHRADWACVRAALKATDDPDSKEHRTDDLGLGRAHLLRQVEEGRPG